MKQLSDLLMRRVMLLSKPGHFQLLGKSLHGIERETLRVDQRGRLAATPHPLALGSALTHPHITTDYAEALLEFVTSAEPDVETALAQLEAVHRFTYANLDGQLLWSQSMPCDLPAEADIDIARYGSSNIGMLKHIYRRGLALRYGKSMQCIAGIHYNFSLSEKFWQRLQTSENAPGSLRAFQSSSYFALIRNFKRYSWLLMYLFGASPALAAGFLRGKPHKLETLSKDTLYLPYATSLRMSDLGYQSDAQSMLLVQLSDVDSYIKSLNEAVSQPYPSYQEIGTHRNGEWVQLSTNLLQIENEYYSTIRPKRVIGIGERALGALATRGVQYVEVRCLDIDPFDPIGISLETARFMDAFLLFCALTDSPAMSECGQVENNNFCRTVTHGRQPGLTLQRHGQAVSLQSWALELMNQISITAKLLDEHASSSVHAAAVASQRTKIDDVTKTPSAQVLAALEKNGNSFAAFGLHMSKAHAETYKVRTLTAEQQIAFDKMAQESLAAQVALEQQNGDFDEFVNTYLGKVHS